MIDEHDPLLARVLQNAKAGAAPDAAALGRAFAGIEQQLRAASVTELTQLARSSQPPVPPRSVASGAARPWAVARWVAWGAVTGVAGFLLGVQYARTTPSSAPIAATATSAVTSPLTVPALAPPAPPVPAPRAFEAAEPAAVRADSSQNRPNPAGGRDARARVDLVKPAASASDDPLGFDAVLERLARAQRAQRTGLAGDALALIDEIDRRAAPSVLREERLVTRVLVACDLHDDEAAKTAALALGDGASASIYAGRLGESCVGAELGAARARVQRHEGPFSAARGHPLDMNTDILNRSISARGHHFAIQAALSGLLAACAGTTDPHNLGDTADEPSDDATFAPGVSAYAGVWIGEAEAPLSPSADGTPGTYVFPSGSTRIRLEYRPSRAAKLSFGEGAPPPVADFDVGYPPGLDYLSPTLWGSPVHPPIEGFEYNLMGRENTLLMPAEDLRRSPDDAMRFLLQPNQGYAEWCSGQQPYLHGTYYDCLASSGSGLTLTDAGYECKVVSPTDPTIVETEAGPGDLADVPVDCGKYYLCAGTTSPACTCDEFTCFFNSNSEASLFLRRIGDQLLGSFSGLTFFDDEGLLTTLGSVRFRRVEE